MEFKMVCEGMNLPSSQITCHPNKAPIKIQPLPLLIGLGSDRQPELRRPFRFQEDYHGFSQELSDSVKVY